MYTCSGNVHGSVHGQPRIEPRPWPSSPSALTNTLTCIVQLYCNYSYSLNKKYRQFGELPFQVSMLSASCMHACEISFRRRHVKERFKSENFPPFWILLILDVFLMHVPVLSAQSGLAGRYRRRRIPPAPAFRLAAGQLGC